MPSALVVYGGWKGHFPLEVAEILAGILRGEGFTVELADTLNAFADEAKLMKLDLIVPHWTMDDITREQVTPILKAVESGVGLAGCHGGMGDAFRKNTEWQFMTGGQFVAHPGNHLDYRVHIKDQDHEITAGLSDFHVHSEQYYMHIDPAIRVLATTTFPTAKGDGAHVTNGFVEMPQVWTKRWGKGRVFYNALGHAPAIFDIPEVKEMMRRGFVWAAKK